MKKFFAMVMAVVSMVAVMTSCNNSDPVLEPKPQQPQEQQSVVDNTEKQSKEAVIIEEDPLHTKGTVWSFNAENGDNYTLKVGARLDGLKQPPP